MPKIIYVEPSGSRRTVDASRGETLMSAAVRSGVAGIVGECGGNSSCATCHVWVRPEFRDRVGPAVDIEDDLLDLAVAERRSGSRLGCQVAITEELEGLVVDVPQEQP